MDATELAVALAGADDADVVRLVGDWMDRAARDEALDLSVEPALESRRHVNALVAAAAAQVARDRSLPTPEWTLERTRMSETFWHPGPAALFANALVHAPGEFAIRGVFIEADSLRCV